MSCSDPIADMLTSIRNAQQARLAQVEMPHSKLKGEIIRVLKREGYVRDFVVENTPKKTLRVYLKYTAENEPAILGLRRLSRCGGRRYAKRDKIPFVLSGSGIVVVSTSAGVMTDKEARKQRVGGELLCTVW